MYEILEWYSLLAIFYLPPVPTGAPSKPEIISFDSSSVTLAWLPPATEESNGIIRSYTISIYEHGSGSSFETSSRFLNKTIDSLHPFYTYSFKVRAETIGPGPYGAEVSIQLEEAGMLSSVLVDVHVYHHVMHHSIL